MHLTSIYLSLKQHDFYRKIKTVSLTSDKILNALLDGLSVKDLEIILEQKKDKLSPDHKLKPMTEKQRLKNHYRNLLLSRGNLYLPKNDE